jgi:diguanylate cyclase (GGDEF)-like protein
MDERELMGPVSGLLWIGGAGVAIAGWAMPGAPHSHPALFWGLVALTLVYAAGCVSRAIPWHRASLTGHAIAVALLQPLVGAALWLTGGAGSYMAPVLVLPMLYVAYFFPPRLAWPLAVLEIGTYASPLLTSPGPHHLLVQRTLGYGVAYVAVVCTIQFLKRRLVAAERHQHAIARQDPLTGLANRRAFEEQLAARVDEAERYGHPVGVLLLDLDGFKGINDTYGHAGGDAALKALSDCLVRNFPRKSDLVARYGGEELAIVLPDTSTANAVRLAERTRQAVRDMKAAHGAQTIGITVSIGVAQLGRHESVQAWLERADRALYQAKSEGRDRVVEALPGD